MSHDSPLPMQLLTLGLNHTTAPLALREKVSFPGDVLRSALDDLKSRLAGRIPEAAILSTCNRTEIYCVTEAPAEVPGAIAQWLGSQHGLDSEPAWSSHLYTLPDGQAVRHAFRVAAGLDSMVLGEPQILGQMKDAARVAQEAGSLGTHLHHLFQRSFAVAKEIRTTTEIGAHSVSMAAAAVRLAKRIFEDLRESNVLFVGAGEMIELAATHFAAQHPKRMVVANRTVERAQKLSQRFGAQAIRLADLPEVLAQFDVVVSCTASSLPIIGKGLVERASRARRRKPMFMVDLAVPRDIEAEVGKLPDVFLYTIDDLGKLVQSGLANRQAAVAQAEAIIETRADAFMKWLAGREMVPRIQALHARGEAVKLAELERAQKALARGDDASRVLEQLASALTAKFLHGPTTLLTRPGEDQLLLARLVEQLVPEVRSSGDVHSAADLRSAADVPGDGHDKAIRRR